MYPNLLNFTGLSLSVPSYGFFLFLGVYVALSRMRNQSDLWRDSYSDNQLVRRFLGFFLCAALGSRILFLAIHLPSGRTSLSNFLDPWDAGTFQYGAFLGGALGLFFLLPAAVSKRRLWDSLLHGVMIVVAFGRIGCFCAGDDYGLPSDLPWAVQYPWPLHPDSAFPSELAEAGVRVHPTQLYLSLGGAFLWFSGCFVRRTQRFRDGMLGFFLLAVHAGWRAFVESMRGDSIDRGGLWSSDGSTLILSSTQMLAFGLFTIGTVGFFLSMRSGQDSNVSVHS